MPDRVKPPRRRADNPRVMLATVPAPPGPPTAVWLVAVAVAGAAWSLRALRRRERRHGQRCVADLAVALREFIEHRLSAEALAEAAAAAESGAFWSALEELTSRGPGWLALSHALAGCPHFEAERRALREESPWRRELAARRLGLLYAPASRRALHAALAEGPELVTAAAAAALGRYRDRETLRWVLAHPTAIARRPHRARVALLRAFGRRGLPELAAALERGTGEPAMDRALIEALGLARHHAARITVERRLREGDVEQRIAAARALGRMQATDCATALVGALADEAWPVRAQAAHALGILRAEIGLLALPARLTDPAWWVRHHAAHALRQYGEEGRRVLEHIAGGSPDPYARDMARDALEARPRVA